MVRFVRGELSTKNVETDMIRSEKEKKNFMKRTFTSPESDYKEVEPIKVAKNIKKLLILSDIHIPYHDPKALDVAINYGINIGVDGVYLNGDTIDMYQASRYVKDRRLRDLAGELEMTREFLKSVKETFSTPIYYKIGNHEDRWETYLRLQAPELLGIPDFKLSNILRFGEMGIIEVESKTVAYAGKLALLHGHEFGHQMFSPVNAARGLYMRAKESSVVGHHHQTSEHTEKSLSGRVVTTWSMGCLCGLKPDYFPVNKWNSGFGVVHIDPDGTYEFDNLKIIEGKVR
jgi:predicted phosphodiesterase